MNAYKDAEDLALGLYLAKWDNWGYVDIIKNLKQGIVLEGIIIYNNTNPNLLYLAECIVQANFDLVKMYERGLKENIEGKLCTA